MKKPARASTVAEVPVVEPSWAPGMCLGRVVSVGDDVRVESPQAGPTKVRLATALSRVEIAEAAVAGHLAVLLVEEGPSAPPLLLGMVPPPEGLAPEGLAPEGLAPEAPSPEPQSPSSVVEADVDGRRVKIEAQDEIVFRCGKASVTLRRNGRVVIKGTYVETESQGTNRIKGAQIRLN